MLLDAPVARGSYVHRLLRLRVFTALSAADNAVTTFVAWVNYRCLCPVRTIAFCSHVSRHGAADARKGGPQSSEGRRARSVQLVLQQASGKAKVPTSINIPPVLLRVAGPVICCPCLYACEGSHAALLNRHLVTPPCIMSCAFASLISSSLPRSL